MVIFIDASIFCAYANKDDVHHKESLEIVKSISGKEESITTDYIFDESVTVALRRVNKEAAISIGQIILNSETFLVPVEKNVFDKAWEIFQKTEKLSFTDCTNLAFMQTFGIGKIATFDKAFKEVKGIEVVD